MPSPAISAYRLTSRSKTPDNKKIVALALFWNGCLDLGLNWAQGREAIALPLPSPQIVKVFSIKFQLFPETQPTPVKKNNVLVDSANKLC
jgi:hypothetical protein